MVSIRVSKSSLQGSVRCPSSKSYTHRAIAIASLAEGVSKITNPLLARDTLATISSCRAFGASIEHNSSYLTIQGKHIFGAPDNVINAENSGTTIRIMIAFASLVEKGYTVLTGDESLRKRPMQPILDALKQLGVECFSTKQDGTAPIIVKGGGLEGGRSIIDGSVSSQFISALLTSGIYSKSGITIQVNGRQVSKPYIDATIATMRSFGIEIPDTKDHSLYMIPNNNSYKHTDFEVPSDFSTAALILSGGVLCGKEVVVEGLNFDLPQGDSKIIDILKEIGADIEIDKTTGHAVASGSEYLGGGDFDLSDTPDLLPVVSILALKCRNPVRIKGVAHARLKETDRIANIATELTKMGAEIKEYPDGLNILAPKKLRNASLEAYNDHRLFMAFSIASMLTQDSIVAGAESVDVSYPNFIQDMKKLGAKIRIMPDRE
jgi:3-phosphoshikimate 1-carboxyvinyltransferase